MTHYTKLAVLAMRSMGLIILFYAVPMIAWGVLRAALGATKAADGVTTTASATFAWMVYAGAGVLLILLAEPLGRFAARGLDGQTSGPPAV
jgi:hypothetical protein